MKGRIALLCALLVAAAFVALSMQKPMEERATFKSTAELLSPRVIGDESIAIESHPRFDSQQPLHEPYPLRIITPTPTPDAEEGSESRIAASTPLSETVGASALDAASRSPAGEEGTNTDPALDALRDVAEQYPDHYGRDGFTPGSSAPHDRATAIASAALTPSPTATPLALLEGQARGYAMLYLMAPGARQTVEGELAILERAQVKDLYLGVLIDGTFGKDFNYLSDVVRRLNQSPHTLTLALYLSNGSAMRRATESLPSADFNSIEPITFRSLIRFDPDVRAHYVRMVQEAQALFAFNSSLNPANRNLAIPMLEDNLDAESYRAMRALTAQVLGDLVEYVRNPCPNCGVSGSDSEAFGDLIEVHDIAALEQLGGGGGFTFDGSGYVFPGESPGVSGDIPFEQALFEMRRALQSGAEYVGLWRAKRQGITSPNPPSQELRRYEVPGIEQSELEVTLLREGLSAVAESSDSAERIDQ